MDYKALYEKELRAKEAYKKVNKKQSDKIKELKKEIAEKEQLNQEKKEFYENLADKAKEATSIIKNQKHQIHQLEATIETIKCLKEQVDASLKEENKELKKEIENWKKIDMDLLESEYMMGKDTEIHKLKKEIEKLKKENEKHKKELLIASFDGYKAGCNYNQSVEDEIDFLNESGESPELIKEVFDESYEGGLNLVYNIETKDYSGEEEEKDGCFVCGRNFNLENAISCNRKAYNEYLGSDKDDGDVCLECIEKIK
tara:strand:- start:2466 stop:3236 length:771 start_codon:yes stop_codon:yes gene_type:complete